MQNLQKSFCLLVCLFLNTISGGETKGPTSKRNILREASIQSSCKLQSEGKYEL